MLLLTIKKFTNLAERSQHLSGFRALSASQRFRAAQRFRVPRQQLERSRPIRTPYSPDGARGTPPPRAGARGHPTRGARDGCRVHRGDTSVSRPRRADIRVGASARSRRSGASARSVASEERGMVGSREARCTGRVRSAEGAMHGQGQKRERYGHPNPDSSIPETTS